MRRNDWRPRLISYLARTMAAPFEYGRNDCALFVAGAVEAMTGVDHARGWRGYRSLSRGLAKLQEKGFGDHVALVSSIFEECPVAFAREGDIAVLNEPAGPALGIVQGEAVYILRHEGVALAPLIKAERAFHV